MNDSHYHDGPPRHRLQAAATVANTSPKATGYEQALAAIAAAQSLPLGDLDLARWNAIPYDYAELEQLPAIGKRVLWVSAGMIAWASRIGIAQNQGAAFARSFADVVRYAIAQGDVEMTHAAQTMLRVRGYRELLTTDAREVKVARTEAKKQADDTAVAIADRENAWVRDAAKQAVAQDRPVDPQARASLEPVKRDYAPLEHYDRELSRIDAIARTLDAREAQALTTLIERRFEKVVLKEDG